MSTDAGVVKRHGGVTWPAVSQALTVRIGESKFQRWFADLRVVEDDGDRWVLGVPNLFIQGWIESNYLDDIRESVRSVLGARQVRVKIDGELYRRFRAEEAQEQPRSESDGAEEARDAAAPAGVELREALASEAAPVAAPTTLPDDRGVDLDGLNDDLTLDRFVVGACNHVAFNASMDVLRLPGKSYNPLFVYGGSGLGKTHLLQGLTRELFRRGVRKIRYLTCEGFVNRFVRALQKRSLDAFRRRFQRLEVLVLDDVHVLQGKPQTQMELLHTIDAIASAGGQVILASDSRPQAIEKLQKQLQGRFVGGLVCRMDPPDYPTRLQILQQEVKNRSAVVPEGVLHLLADQYYRNVRELIGALTRLLANAALLGEPLTIERAAQLLEQREIGAPAVSLEGIASIAATRHGLTVEGLQSRSRARTVSLARQEAIYLARVLTEHSLAELGRFFGGRNHATVNFAFRRVVERIQDDDAYRRELEGLLEELRG
ncbi:MAG: chromosomal replication initiator protein DnaA [Planctomycetota bacterium]